DFMGISRLDVSWLEPEAAPAADAPPLATASEANKYFKSTPGVPLSPAQLYSKRFRAYACTVAQVAMWLFGMLEASVLAAFVLDQVVPYTLYYLSKLQLVILLTLLGTVVPLFWCMLSLVLAVVAKKLIIGKYRAGVYPIYGWFHFRHWLVQRFVSLVRR